MGHRAKVHLDVAAYISPAGVVRSPGVWVKVEDTDQIVAKETLVQSMKCSTRLAEQIEFPPYATGPRTVFQSFDWTNPR
jgi:hypothetical protein